MAGAHMLFPIEPEEFWRQMRTLIEEILERKINSKPTSVLSGELKDKSLLKMTDICKLFEITKPTVYDWVKQGKLKSIKIQSRRYFLIKDIEHLIKSTPTN